MRKTILAVGLMGLFAACGGSSKSEETTPEAVPAEAAPAEGEAAPAEGTEAAPAEGTEAAPAEGAPAPEAGAEGGGW